MYDNQPVLPTNPNTRPETRAFAYVRVSTTRQEEAGTHENQIKAIKDYANARGLLLIDGEYPAGSWFTDLAQSGADENREKLNVLLESLNDVKHVVFFDWSRISRDQLYSNYLLFLFNKEGVFLHDVSKGQPLALEDEDQVFMKQLDFYFAQKERKKIKERQKMGIQRFIENHGKWGRVERIFTPKECAEYKRLREAKVSKSGIARVLRVSRTVLYRNIKLLKLDEVGIMKGKTE